MEVLYPLFHECIDMFLDMAPYLLLGLAIAGFLHIMFKKETILKHLGTGTFLPVIKAALLGVPLPLCSCGVVPTALSLRKNNASEGATVSFLIATPQTGIDSIMAMYGLLGGVFALFTPIAALVTGIVGGVAVSVCNSSGTVSVPYSPVNDCTLCQQTTPHTHSFLEKIKGMARYAFRDFLDDISVQLVAGILISAVVGYLLPDDFFSRYIKNDVLSMLLVIAAGVPLYICATASIPIALVLMMKGLSPGAAFVFLTVGPATNAATITMVAHALGKKITAIYLLALIGMAVLSGVVLNALYTVFGTPTDFRNTIEVEDTHSPVVVGLSVFFALLLTISLYRNIRKKITGAPYKTCCTSTDCCSSDEKTEDGC